MRALLPITTAVFLTPLVHGDIFGWGKPKDVQVDAGVNLVPFDSLDCTGDPQQPAHPMIHDKCLNFLEAGSVMPMFMKGHHADWIDEVNNLRMHCKLQTFGQYHCTEVNRTVEYRHGATDEQPKNLNKCLVPTREKYEDEDGTDNESFDDDDYARSHAIRSAVFLCGPVEKPEHIVRRTLMHTSWSVEPGSGSLVSDVQEAIYTGSLSVTPHTKVADAEHTKVAARGATVKAGGESKGVWLLHPWELSMMCYRCYTNKANDYRKIECRSGTRHPVDCGPMPTAEDGNPARHSTVTSTMTAVSTTHTTRTKKSIAFKDTTSTVSSVTPSDDSPDKEFPNLEIKLNQKRSWHTPVKFPHPFMVGKDACADAEWEKRGQGSKSYVKIQDAHVCGHKDRSDSRWLGFSTTVIHTSTTTKTSTKTASHTSTSTSTALVVVTTTKIVKHDQL